MMVFYKSQSTGKLQAVNKIPHNENKAWSLKQITNRLSGQPFYYKNTKMYFIQPFLSQAQRKHNKLQAKLVKVSFNFL